MCVDFVAVLVKTLIHFSFKLFDSMYEMPILFCSKPNSDILREYKRKVDFLQGVVQAEKLVSQV